MSGSEEHTAAATMQIRVRDCIREMLSYIEAAAYAGYDPYDALNSPLLNFVTGKSRWARMAATPSYGSVKSSGWAKDKRRR